MKISQDAWKSYIDQLGKINNKAAEKVLEAVKNLLADPQVKKAIKRKAVEELRTVPCSFRRA